MCCSLLIIDQVNSNVLFLPGLNSEYLTRQVLQPQESMITVLVDVLIGQLQRNRLFYLSRIANISPGKYFTPEKGCGRGKDMLRAGMQLERWNRCFSE